MCDVQEVDLITFDFSRKLPYYLKLPTIGMPHGSPSSLPTDIRPFFHFVRCRDGYRSRLVL